MKTSQVDVEFEAVSVPCTAKDLRATFGWLLKEMRSVGKILRPDERDILRKIMEHQGGPLTVSALFLTFEREGEAHKTLRRLRATQFIYPASTGRWEPDEPIEVTPFARLVWNHIGEERIFSPPPLDKVKHPVDVRTPMPAEQRVVTWDNLLECVRERQKAQAAAAEPDKN